MPTLVRVLVLILLMTTCTPPAAAPSSSDLALASGGVSLKLPLAPSDPEALAAADAKLRAEDRTAAGLEKLGPQALEVAAMMDRTGGFMLSKASSLSRAQAGYPTVALREVAGTVSWRTAPLADVPPPGSSTIGMYAMAIVVFKSMVEDHTIADPRTPTADQNCPCTNGKQFDPYVTDLVAGDLKGHIVTTFGGTVTVSTSKVSADLTLKIYAELRDASGALVYRIEEESSGHAEGDVCPDASGVAHATMSMHGKEAYFDEHGVRTGSGARDMSGEFRFKADDNATLVDVGVSGNGKGADFLMSLAAQNFAPAFEKAWRSGTCIAVVADPGTGDVQHDSVTTVTVKVKQKIEGTELDKPIEAVFTGAKSLDPAGTKQKAPATYTFTAGPTFGDKGILDLKSTSNRGIGRTIVVYTVGGESWTLSARGTSNETVAGVANTFTVAIKDLKVAAGPLGLTGAGTITLTGSVTTALGPIRCRGQLDQTMQFTASRTIVGTRREDQILRLTLHTVGTTDPGTITMTCLPGGAVIRDRAVGYSDRWGRAIGQIDLPAAGGTRSFTRSVPMGGGMTVDATATITVVHD